MWTLERDPHLASGFANITLLDRPADVERMRARLQPGLARIPQLRRRVQPGRSRLAPPRWVDDPDLDLERHVRSLTLDPPGSLDQVIDAAMAFCHRPYDAAHPLWEFLLIDGLDDGRGAMVQRMHHTLTDGIGGVRMSEQFIDLERDAPVPEPLPIPTSNAADAVGWSDVAATLDHTLRRQLGAAQRGSGRRGRARRPPRPGRRHVSARDRVHQGARRTRRPPSTADAHRCGRNVPWTEHCACRGYRSTRYAPWGRRTAHRSTTSSSPPPRGVQAPTTGHAGRRSTSSAWRCRSTSGPTGPRRETRSAPPACWSRPAPTPSTASAPSTSGSHTCGAPRRCRWRNPSPDPPTCSPPLSSPASLDPRSPRSTSPAPTCGGAPFPLYLAGARIESNHPIGPLVGTAFNLTTISYDGSLDLGLHIDRGAVHLPDLLADCIDAAFDELLAS